MGATVAKSDLQARYREQVSAWLRDLQTRHDLSTQDKLAAALRRDRTTAGRYLNGKVDADLVVLEAFADSLGEKLPEVIKAAFYKLGALGDLPSRASAEVISLPSKSRARRPTSGSDVAMRAIREMPIINTVAAGKLTDPSSQIEGEYQTIEIGGLPPGDYFATRVSGTSMNRISPPGSLIVVNRAERELIRGRRYILGRRGETTYKRFETAPMRLEPETTEPDANPTIFPRDEEEWTVIGRVRLTLMDDL